MENRRAIIVLFALSFIVVAILLPFYFKTKAQRIDEGNSETSVTIESTSPFSTIPETTIEQTTETVNPGFTYSERVPLSRYLQEVMQQACEDYGVPYSLALGVAECESSFNLEADSGICWGVMQIHPCNYPRLRNLGIEPTEYDGNIAAGVFMLGELLDKYGDTHKALMAYNCGETGAARLWKKGYTTSTYSEKVVKRSDYWQRIIEK